MQQEQKSVSTDNWDLAHAPLEAIDRSRVASRENLFYILTAASFVEIAADLYTDNLVEYFSGDEEAVKWLDNKWKIEEVGHGQVLRDYVRHVWPEFDWDSAYASFFEDYSRLCTVEEFESTRGLEMVARCVVETGTATFYQAVAELADEPVLIGIANRIRAQEINHYKHFFRLFRKYRETEAPSRLQIALALRRRIFEARQDDAECALWHAYLQRNPDAQADKAQFEQLEKAIAEEVKYHYPIEMAAKMLLRPLRLPGSVNRIIEGPIARWTSNVFMH